MRNKAVWRDNVSNWREQIRKTKNKPELKLKKKEEIHER